MQKIEMFLYKIFTYCKIVFAVNTAGAMKVTNNKVHFYMLSHRSFHVSKSFQVIFLIWM